METNGKFYMTDMIRSMLKGMHYQFNGDRLIVKGRLISALNYYHIIN